LDVLGPPRKTRTVGNPSKTKCDKQLRLVVNFAILVAVSDCFWAQWAVNANGYIALIMLQYRQRDMHDTDAVIDQFASATARHLDFL
jgi:hypothetical protein